MSDSSAAPSQDLALSPSQSSLDKAHISPPQLVSYDEICSIIKAKRKRSWLDRDFWTQKFLDASSQDPELKKQLFRLVDVLPSLGSYQEIWEHFHSYLKEYDLATLFPEIGGIIRWGAKGTNSIKKRIISQAVRAGVSQMARQFIIAENIESATRKLTKLRKNGTKTTVDLLGEYALSIEDGNEYRDAYIKIISSLKSSASTSLSDAQIISDGACVSVKLSALYPHISQLNEGRSIAALVNQLTPIIEAAEKAKVSVYFDAEDTSYNGIIVRAFKELFCDKFKHFSAPGLVIQAYLRSSYELAQDMIEYCRENQRKIGIRLVKGAYWDKELASALEKNWDAKVYLSKKSTDDNYNDITNLLLANTKHIYPAFGSHNVKTLLYAVNKANGLGIAPDSYELQTLFGMAPEIGQAFQEKGLNVRIYTPVGATIPGMGYLVRRLLENSSNQSFLKQFNDQNAEFDGKTTESEISESDGGARVEEREIVKRHEFEAQFFIPFTNASPVDFSKPQNAPKYQQKIASVCQSLASNPPTVRPSIRGAEVNTSYKIESIAPATEECLANIYLAEQQDFKAAYQKLHGSKCADLASRIEDAKKLAQIIEKNRVELTAIICAEVGKSYEDADYEVCEAIDFCNFYAQQASSLASRATSILPGENCSIAYVPRGLTLVIAPWNFPLAILTGMTIAALLAGNPVIIKPAEQASLIGSYLTKYLSELPSFSSMIAFLPAIGEVVGNSIDGNVKTIAFTGSKEVGYKLMQASAADSSQEPIRVIAELGGKNAMILDSDADLDDAIPAIVKSAFGFAGQKCSALSRLIVHRDKLEIILNNLEKATKELFIGNTIEPHVNLGPVIDNDSHDRIKKFIDETSFKQVARSLELPEKGYFISPKIYYVPPEHLECDLWSNELFAPILAVTTYTSFDEAISIANNSRYALTGGLFSRNDQHIALFKEKYDAGNLYINRTITGSIVSRQPFGGHKCSGVGTKAGGENYLLQFTNAKVIAENTIRKGFTPEL